MEPRPTYPPALRAWLDADPDVTADEADRVWELAGQALPGPTPDPERAAALWKRIETATRLATPQARVLPFWSSRLTWVAAAACIAILIAVGVMLWAQPITYTAPPGRHLAVTLPDGSAVRLNSGARLTYDRAFRPSSRMARLEGEAFFDVARAGKPFRVETFNAAVEVLGTRFNVRAHPQEQHPKTEVAVETGRVQVQPTHARTAPVVLSPGESYTVGGVQPLAEPEARDVSRITNWRQGGLYFREATLRDIFDELERRYNVDIFSNDPAVLGARRTWHKHDPGTVEALLEELCAPTGCRFRATANGYEVFSE